eukprot:gnl/TRDRNA2_/TRDRNA2_200180_c0_seq1.p1 gnl/TRDRNA2_/TRDRNA2_200180_c0~~gnl/TRDRNA2_/TRDRNA2_200180_c0_seq1.p1  ORF type:complete len:232 (-),score=61.25 gnl/TRDRNA2_/TRDRNA2_200180_c0_seq1:24-719(-)
MSKRKRAEEGAPIVEEGGPPAWLTAQFPQHAKWSTWRVCKVKVDGQHGAGLKLEATDGMGYRVLSVERRQEEALKAGVVILGVGGYPLFGLDSDDIEAAYRQRLADGLELQLLDWQELRAAEIERDGEEEAEAAGGGTAPSEELSGDGSLNVLPLGEKAVRNMDPEARASLEGDLQELGKLFGVTAEVRCPATLSVDSVSLRGDPAKVTAARLKLQDVLDFYDFSIPRPNS